MDIEIKLKKFPPGTVDQAEVLFYDSAGVVRKVLKLTSTVPFIESTVFEGGQVLVRKFAIPSVYDKEQKAGVPGKIPAVLPAKGEERE